MRRQDLRVARATADARPMNAESGSAVLEDHVVPARGSWSGVVRKGETLRIVDAEGQG